MFITAPPANFCPFSKRKRIYISYLYQLNLRRIPVMKTLEKKHRMHRTDSKDACDCFNLFIYIFKQPWKKKPWVAGNLWKNWKTYWIFVRQEKVNQSRPINSIFEKYFRLKLPSYRNQSIDLQSHLIDWFLHDLNSGR